MTCEHCRPWINEVRFKNELPSLSIDGLHCQLFTDSEDSAVKVIVKDDIRKHEYTFSFGDINYCMMCGRKLSDGQEE